MCFSVYCQYWVIMVDYKINVLTQWILTKHGRTETYCPSGLMLRHLKLFLLPVGLTKNCEFFFVINWKHCSLILSTITIGFGIKTQHYNYYPLCCVKGISFPWKIDQSFRLLPQAMCVMWICLIYSLKAIKWVSYKQRSLNGV